MSKPFKETKLGKFLTSSNSTKLIDTVGKITTGNWVGAASNIKDIIKQEQLSMRECVFLFLMAEKKNMLPD